MTDQLKYEHIQPGTRIRAWDFERAEGRRDRYVEGVVVKHVWHHGAKMLEIIADVDTAFTTPTHTRVDRAVLVPMETMMEDLFEKFHGGDRVEVLVDEADYRGETWDDITDEDLADMLEHAQIQHGEVLGQHNAECSAFGDSWPGACQQIDDLARYVTEIETEINRRANA